MGLIVANQENIVRSIVFDILSWIESDLSREMSSIIIARRAGYSNWHMQRIFKQATGYTISRYIRARRMTLAAKLIKTSDLYFTEIFVQIGFSDSSTFCRAFQNYFGIPPTMLRYSEFNFTDKMLEPILPGMIAQSPHACLKKTSI